jgi:ABC-type Co2+ transport system permease subunit
VTGDFIFRICPILLLAEVLATVFMSRKRVRRRLAIAIGSYLALVAASLAFALISPDRYGFSIFPTLYLTAPWFFIYPLSISFIPVIVLGTTLNCAILWLVDRISYPKHIPDPVRGVEN